MWNLLANIVPFSLQAETAWTMQLTNFWQLSSQQLRALFGSEGSKSCSFPCKAGGAFGPWNSGSWALNWAMGGGRAPTAIGNRNICSGNESKCWFRWPWNWEGFEYRLWLCCCPLSGWAALVLCWFPMVRGTVFPSLALLGTDPSLAELRPCWNLCRWL